MIYRTKDLDFGIGNHELGNGSKPKVTGYLINFPLHQFVTTQLGQSSNDVCSKTETIIVFWELVQKQL